MAVREIPTQFEHMCDACGCSEMLASKSRPKHWADLQILRDAYDYQGCAVADASIKRLLCEACADAIVKAINHATAERRSKSTPEASADRDGM